VEVVHIDRSAHGSRECVNGSPRRPALRYHGGKWALADWIISNFPSHRAYVEIFGGGASILLRKARSYAEVYNDRWDVVVNVFRVLRDPELARELKRVLLLTPYARSEFDACMPWDDGPQLRLHHLGDVEAARQTILRSLCGFSSASTNADYYTGFRARAGGDRRRGGEAQKQATPAARDWMHYAEHIESFTERLRGVLIENRDWRELIPHVDHPEALFYVDPPYLAETRALKSAMSPYVHDMDERDHRCLAKVLHQVEGMVVLSGYPSRLYDETLYADWARREKSGGLADGRGQRTEVLWLNSRAVANSSQQRLFAS
jgi:DNA adenine methylase